ncbi:serine protease Hayan-like isoform X2 [Planococcus citri]|uniref:serine protease Hayan-like isoform X2 n=1 Tax=Planococcus citri TaxID=170843 RepID=UPI0031F885CD
MERLSIRCILIVIPILFMLHLCQAKEDRKRGNPCNTHFDCSKAREIINAERTMPCANRHGLWIYYFEKICGPVVTKSATSKPMPSSKNSTGIQIALQKCQEYGEHRYVYEWDRPQLPDEEGCYQKNMVRCTNPLPLYQKPPAKTQEFHHMALIGYGKELKNVSWDCDGALISEKFVMSSAHCSESALGPPQWVLLKDVVFGLLEGYMPKSKVYSIVKIHVHSNYKSSSFHHDISLIELNTTVTFSPYLRPACLHTPTSDIPRDRNAVITGWERTGIAEQTSNTLLVAGVEIVDHHECEASFNGNATKLTRVYDSSTMICGRDAYAGQSWDCRSFEESHIKADSGGVLQIPLRDEICQWNIIGIASFGTGICQHNKYPGMYTKVSHYVDWIQSVVWPSQ